MGKTKTGGWNAGVEESRTSGAQAQTQRFGSKADRRRTPAWTASAGIRHGVVDEPTGGRSDRTGMRGSVQRGARLAHSAQSGLELPTANGKSSGTRRKGHSAMEARALAGAKKNADIEGRTIVFIDESGLSQRPHRCRTWSPKGQTPVLQYCFNWKKLSAVAGITWCNFYFELHPGSIKSPQVIKFLSHLKRHIKRKLLVIWDRSKPHRSRLVKDFVAKQNSAICIEYLPAYAPELNPVEYIWGYWKHHELRNFCPKTFSELSYHSIQALKRMRRRPKLITAFWQQAELFWSLYYPKINSLHAWRDPCDPGIGE